MDRNLKLALALVAIIGALLTTIYFGPIIYEADDHDEVDNENVDNYDIDVVTHESTMISSMFATLNGELVDMGDLSSVEVYFVWGENPGEYTKETPRQTMTSPGVFSAEISDLFMPDTTYYFQARSNPEGSGEELSFYVN